MPDLLISWKWYLLKSSLYKEKVTLANDILDKKLLSTDFLYEKIFNMNKTTLNGV